MGVSAIIHNPDEMPAVSTEQPERSGSAEGLVVLSRDRALIETLKAIGVGGEIRQIDIETDLASHLAARHAGVAVLDAAAIATPIGLLTEHLKRQFPDLVLIVAGGSDDQNALASQITNGTVYRFLHKPVSQQRVRLFVEAARRRHEVEHARDDDPLAATGVLPVERAALPRNMVIAGGAALCALVAIAGWFMTRKPQAPSVPTAISSATPTSSLTPPVRDEELESLLARADKALQDGALVSPPRANAADLYRAALQRNHEDPRPAGGIDKVIDRLSSAADEQLGLQHLNEAQKLIDQARALEPNHPRVAFLTAQIAKERERALLAQARQAASNGDIEGAIAILETASRGQPSSLVTQARHELEQKKSAELVSEYLAKADDRARRGQLIEPAQDNAQFYIESARTLKSSSPEIDSAEHELAGRLVSQARKALAAGNPDESDRWIKAAAESGAGKEDVAALTREAQRVRTAAKADAMARLALLFNQRVAQGRLADPPADSAKFYLAQLMQSDSTHPSTLLAKQAFAARSMDEAKAAVRRQDYAGARRWLSEAHDAGIDDTSISAVQHDITAAEDNAQRANEVVSASSLSITRYVPPEFPVIAAERGIDGWVDVEFLVKSDGSVADITVVGAEPVGVFEQAATDAIHKWKYRAPVRDGKIIEQRARLRMRFELKK